MWFDLVPLMAAIQAPKTRDKIAEFIAQAIVYKAQEQLRRDLKNHHAND